MSELPAWPYPRYWAHRGAGKQAPENTLAAFRLGAAFGYSAFECDVKLSADGKAFLLHDDTLNRTTDGYGRADQYTLGELCQLDAGSWHSTEYAGESLPSLKAILHFINANQFMINVEIKPTIGREYETGAAVAMDVANQWSGDLPPLISSFSESALLGAKAAVPHLPRAWLVDQLPDNWLERLQALDCIAIDANHRILTRAVVETAKQHGLRVLCYTVNDLERAQELIDWGVDSIITDVIHKISPSL